MLPQELDPPASDAPLITIEEFRAELGRLNPQINPAPLGALVADSANSCQFVVAGPGTGKTTALAIRTLKLILVDGIDPAAIVATTFTRRAAKELRSRILRTADDLRRSLLTSLTNPQRIESLSRIDFNRVYTGTLDGLSEEIMTDFRTIGTPPPVVIDENIADALMLFRGLFPHGRFRQAALTNYYQRINGTTYGISPKGLATLVREIHDRALHDGVDLSAYRTSRRRGVSMVVEAVMDYRNALSNEGWCDFALLEDLFLQRLRNGNLNTFTQGIRVLLVDEYQDTNFLQESIYFELARRCVIQGGGITVVGDDDQSLYRFRGATTDLFIQFPTRIHSELGITPSLVYLSENRRSTNTIVNFVTDFVQLDPSYSSIRVIGKPPLQTARLSFTDFPILGMFRDNINQLTDDLTKLIDRVVNGTGFRIPGTQLRIQRDPRSGSAADIILLAYSPQEVSSNDKPLLPHLLRTRLANLRHPIQIYNPRGRSLESIQEFTELMGLLLRCIDPNSLEAQRIGNLPGAASSKFADWRRAAARVVRRNPLPRGPPSLRDFVNNWSHRQIPSRGPWTTGEVPLLQLIYKLVTWIRFFHEDLEGLAYLEAINRTVTSSATIGKYEANVSFTSVQNFRSSVKELYWNFFVPMALDFIDVDEDLLETLPNNRLGVFSIHQSKGLEFPLVVVDVGSSFRNNHHAHRFKRFPDDDGKISRLEDELRPFSQLGRSSRSGVDRCFDDLSRQYFVSFSRAQDVLLLVGLNSMINDPAVPHVATGWRRDGSWPWNGLPSITMI